MSSFHDRYRVFRFSIVLLASLLAFSIASCGGGNTSSSSQDSKTSGPKSMAMTLNFPETVSSPAARGVSPANAARALPSYVTGIQLTISGDGMDTIVVDVPLDTLTVTVYMTNGLRRFDIAVFTNIGATFTASVIAEIGLTASPTLAFDLNVNTPPVISGLSASSSSVNKSTGVTITATASDADGDPISYSWSASGGSISGSGSSVTWTSATVSGDYTITVTADDGRGGTDTASTTVTVVNRAPVVRSVTSDTTTPNIGHNAQLSCSATDADGDRLTYSWSDGKGWTATGDTATYTVNTSGATEITCTVSDGDRNGTATGTVTLNAQNRAPAISAFTVYYCNQAPVNGTCNGIARIGASEATTALVQGWRQAPSQVGCTPRYYKFSCSATDADGDSITYKLQVKATSWQSAVTGPTNFSMTNGSLVDWDMNTQLLGGGASTNQGKVDFSCIASDPLKSENTSTFTITSTGC